MRSTRETNKLRLQPKNQLKESPDHFDALLIGYFALCMALRRSSLPWGDALLPVPSQMTAATLINRKQRNPNRWRLIDERLALLRQTGRREYIPGDDRDWFWEHV